MGCTSSKDARRDDKFSPFHRRSNSLPIHNVIYNEYHAVISTTSTLGSLRLDDSIEFDQEMMKKSSNDQPVTPEMIADELSEAKNWSKMMQLKIPKTPSMTPPNEPEIINAWELMEGLEDDGSPLCFRFEKARKAVLNSVSVSKTFEEKSSSFSSEQQLMQLSAWDSVVCDFDPEILYSFRKAMEELSPLHQSFLRSPELRNLVPNDRTQSVDVCRGEDSINANGIVKSRIKDFQQEIDARMAKSKFNEPIIVSHEEPESKGKVVFYVTSIRGVRKTYEDCWSIRVILKGYGVRLDERDVSIHSGFKDELNDVLGPGFGGNSLPRVFANGKYLGGAVEVRHLHETGELGKILDGCEVLLVEKGGIEVICEACADVRFILCQTCSGSCKMYVEEEEDDEGKIGSFQRCSDCNENGLTRCPLC